MVCSSVSSAWCALAHARFLLHAGDQDYGRFAKSFIPSSSEVFGGLLSVFRVDYTQPDTSGFLSVDEGQLDTDDIYGHVAHSDTSFRYVAHALSSAMVCSGVSSA